MDVVAKLFRFPRSALIIGTSVALLVLVAVMVFGAPAWILVPAVWISATLEIRGKSWADRRLGSQ